MQTAIVTGASGNLGKAVVEKFLAEGYRVIGFLAPNITMDITHKNFETIVADLMDEAASSKTIEEIINKYQTIDAAVLTVGGFAMGKIADTKMDDMMKQYRLNFQTTYNIARPVFVQMMKQKTGHIFLTGARTGLDMKNSKGTTAYGLSKSLIFRLAELMNEEARGTNVVTSVIAPSIIDTPENRKSMPEADPSKWVKPEHIAAIIYFYCTEEAEALRETIIKVYNNA